MPTLLAFALLCTVACKKEKNTPTPQLTADKTELRLTGEVNYTDSIAINANVPWVLTLSAATDWLEVDAVNGEGNAVVHIKNTKENNGTQNKEVVLTLTCSDNRISAVQIKVSQKPYLKLLLSKLLGGNGTDNLLATAPSADGGQILVGHTNSSMNGDVTGTGHGGTDVWVVKLTSTGTVEWSKMLGGSKNDYGVAISPTSDGGYMIAGSTDSNDGDVTGNHGYDDYWVIKLNSSGTVLWSKTFGGSDVDQPSAITGTQDGGCIVVGGTYSRDGDVTGKLNGSDCWVIKISSNGAIQWNKALGGYGYDKAYSVAVVSGGSYLIAGNTESIDGDVTSQHGGSDGWVAKLSSNGDLIWQKALGGNGYDALNSIVSLPGDEMVVCGSSGSKEGDINGHHGADDGWVAKLSKNGDLQWSKVFGGTNDDFLRSMMTMPDGSIMVTGQSESNDGDLPSNHGKDDLTLLKINNKGEKVWLKTFGGSGSEDGLFLSRTSEGKYWIGGISSSADGDVSGQHGNDDGWLLQFE